MPVGRERGVRLLDLVFFLFGDCRHGGPPADRFGCAPRPQLIRSTAPGIDGQRYSRKPCMPHSRPDGPRTLRPSRKPSDRPLVRSSCWRRPRDVPGRGLSAATVAIDVAPFRGVLPLPISALRSAKPVLENPRNRHRAIPLTFDQFRYALANAVSEEEAKELFETFAVAAPGAPLFQAAAANLNPWTEAKVDSENPARGPLLIVSGEKDHTVPRAISDAAFKHQQHNEGVTEFVEIPNRGHALTIDSGWREVADTALNFVRRFVS